MSVDQVRKSLVVVEETTKTKVQNVLDRVNRVEEIHQEKS